MATVRLFAGAFVAATLLASATFCAAEEAPRRVVSMNVCTDQLAMLIAAEGQLHSVSELAIEPESSALAEQATRYVLNHGMAEEIFLMRPDLVLAGTYTTQPTVEMLRRVGFRVEEFAPETSFDDVRVNMLRVGRLLGRERRAAALVDELDHGLAALGRNPASGKVVATYGSNGYTVGEGALAAAVIAAAGLENLGSRLGIAGAGPLPLEALILAEPDLIALDEGEYEAPALAQQIFAHPAFAAVATEERIVHVPGRNWICGGPFTLAAAHILQDAAR